MNLATLPADTFKLLYLWIHQANGQSSTIAELMTLARASHHIIKKCLREMAVDGLAHYSGLSESDSAELTTNAFNLFPMAMYPSPMSSAIPPEIPDGADIPAPDQSEEKIFFAINFAETPEKKFFWANREEEDPILILIKDLKGPPPLPPPEKKFFFGAERTPDFSANLAALETHAKLGSPAKRAELAALDHCTPEFIRAHSCQFWHQETHTLDEAGMLATRLRDNWPQPDLCQNCSGNNKYTTGKFSDFVEH